MQGVGDALLILPDEFISYKENDLILRIECEKKVSAGDESG